MELVCADAVEGRDYDPDRLTWLWKVTTEEDKKIIEHTARGVRSHHFEPAPNRADGIQRMALYRLVSRGTRARLRFRGGCADLKG